MNSIALGSTVYTPSKVVCVGRNYAAHIAEMGGGGAPDHPTIFIKPNSAIAGGVREIAIPRALGPVHHEVELCFVVGKTCKDVAPEAAGKYIAGYAVGLDLTLRELQSEAKKAGAPWALAKGFDNAAVLGAFVPTSSVEDPCALDISLAVGGEVRQSSNTREMIFTPSEILAYASRYMTIEVGDIVMTGTPEGVGELKDGDTVIAEMTGLPKLEMNLKRLA